MIADIYILKELLYCGGNLVDLQSDFGLTLLLLMLEPGIVVVESVVGTLYT